MESVTATFTVLETRYQYKVEIKHPNGAELTKDETIEASNKLLDLQLPVLTEGTRMHALVITVKDKNGNVVHEDARTDFKGISQLCDVESDPDLTTVDISKLL